MTLSGGLVGSFAPTAQSAQRHLRQFHALSDTECNFELAKRLVQARISSQLRYSLRATQGKRDADVEAGVRELRSRLRQVMRCKEVPELLGVEGNAAREYFALMPHFLSKEIDTRLSFDGRTRRPPRDRVNALLSFGYALLYKRVVAAIIAVGLHPGVGFYHRPRSSAHPLALDLMELFRVPIVDMAVIGALNRKTFDPDGDFNEVPGQVLLSESGRAKAIEVFERRLQEQWRHPIVGYSLAYSRILELEVRLLEKEWFPNEGGLFARMRLR
jgi:CRISPR-associated protein Cas1